VKIIQFCKDFPHADDGFTVITYKAGQTLEVSDICAAAALRTGSGSEPGAPETKAKGAAPKNKAK
jgi:hypothetical protein